MKARRFIVEAKLSSWRALPGNAFWLEHRGLNPLRNITHRGQAIQLGERRTARGETGWGGTFLKADGLTSHRDQPTRAAGRRGGCCQLRSALTEADSWVAFKLPMAAGGSQGGGTPWRSWKLGRMSQPLSSESSTPPVNSFWQPLLRANRSTAEWSPPYSNLLLCFPDCTRLWGNAVQVSYLCCRPGLQPKGRLLAILPVRVWFLD